MDGQAKADSRKMTTKGIADLTESQRSEPAQEERYELPAGWVWARINNVVQPVSQFNPAVNPQTVYRYVDVSSISNQRFEIDASKVLTGAEAPARARQAIRPGDVLFSTVRPYLRNVALVRNQNDGNVGSTAFCVLRSNGRVESGYLFRWTLTKEFLDDLVPKQRGISYPAVRDADVLEQTIPLPPQAEQRRIVAKIEALFEQSRTARQAMDRIPPLLKKFRQSVLAAAFRGDLTRDWREQNPDVESASVLLECIRTERRRKWEKDLHVKGKDPRKAKHEELKPVDTHELPDLPEGWLWVRLGQLVCRSQNGLSTRFSEMGTLTPVLRLADIKNSRIAMEDLRAIRLNDGEIQKYSLARGDFLVIRVNGSKELVGRGMLFNLDGIFTYCDHFIRYSLFSQEVIPELITLYLDTKRARDHVQFSLVSSAGQNTVSQSSLASLPVPLLPLPEQRQVVARIKYLFAQVDAIEAAVEAVRQRAEKLEQSILARAFRGELVPQDTNDEPATSLLDHIRAERVRSRATKRPTVSHRNGEKYQRRK